MEDTTIKYSEDSIQTLDWKEHIRLRPGMYVGKLGDGSSPDDGIYVLLKEVIDNSIDEFIMGFGKTIEVTINEKTVTIRDYGRGIPLGSVIDCVSKINTGAKYDGKVFTKTVGLNGVGTKAVNALSAKFSVKSIREGEIKKAFFEYGNLTDESREKEPDQRKGTVVTFMPDENIFGDYRFIDDFVERVLWNYVFLNKGLTIIYNGKKFHSENGIKDLLNRNIDSPIIYPIVKIEEDDLEVAFTHSATQYSEQFFSFVNGQHTVQGGTHQAAFREAFVKAI